MKCDRCGARYAEDPSCGKIIHLQLPSRPVKPLRLKLSGRMVEIPINEDARNLRNREEEENQ